MSGARNERPRLVFENVTGGYGSTTIVRDLSGGAIAGEALCVLGRNGVGKIDLDEALCSVICRACSGRVLLDGKPIEASIRRRAGAPA